MKKKTKLTFLAALSSVALAGGVLAINATNFSIVATKGAAQTYQMVFDASNAISASKSSNKIATSGGSTYEFLYTGSHSAQEGYHVILNNGSYISNYDFTIDCLQEVDVTFSGGSLVLAGGQVKSSLYETHTFTESGSYVFTDEMNYFTLTASGTVSLASMTLKYSNACENGVAATEKKITLDGVPTSLVVGKSQAVTISTGSKGTINFVSSDPSVVTTTVTTGKSGTIYKVNAVKEGSCKVYATTSNGLKSAEYTVKVLADGLPSSTVGKTYRAYDNDDILEETPSYITVDEAKTITFKHGDVAIEMTYSSTADEYAEFWDENGTGYLDIKAGTSSLDVFGLIYDDDGNGYEFGNTHTNNPTTFNSYVAVTSIGLDQTSLTLEEGKSATVKATVSPTNADASYEWESSDEDVAIVNDANTASGYITAVSAGNAIIKVTEVNSGLSATVNVTVNSKTAVTAVTITGDNEVTEGKTIQLTATLTPSTIADRTITWSSDNTSVAKVSSSGVVTGVSAGTANITAKCDGVTSSAFTVTVKAPSGETTYPLPASYVGTWYDEYGFEEFSIDSDGVFTCSEQTLTSFEATYTGKHGENRNNNYSYRFKSDSGDLVVDITMWSDNLEVYIVTDTDEIFTDLLDLLIADYLVLYSY